MLAQKGPTIVVWGPVMAARSLHLCRMFYPVQGGILLLLFLLFLSLSQRDILLDIVS